MKWIFLGAIAVVIWLVFRRLGREQRIMPEGSWAAPTPAPSASAQPAGFDKWSGRPSLTFDDFYNQYYATAGVDREHVRSMLQFIGKAGGVPPDKIRPEDRIDEFPKPNLARTVGFIKTLLSGPIARLNPDAAAKLAAIQVETVDDIMRNLDMHKDILSKHLNHEGEEPREESQWR